MFAKLFATCLMCVILTSVVSAYDALPSNWNWKTQDIEFLNSIDLSKLNSWDKSIIIVQKQLVGKDSSNISFADFKELTKLLHKRVAGMMIHMNKDRFKGFEKEALSDPELSKELYVKIFLGSEYLTPIAFRDLLFKDNVILKQPDYEAGMLIHMLSKYEQIISDLPEEVVIKDLKSLKKSYYSRIDVNEKWKKFIIKVELMLKGLQ